MRTGGILGINGTSWSNAHEKRFERAYSQMRDFVGECYGVLPNEIRGTDDLAKSVVLTFLFLRSLEFAQAATVLKRSGLTSPAKAALRSLLENLFVIAACAKDPRNVEVFVGQHEWKRFKTLNKVKASSSENLSFLRQAASEQPHDEIKSDANQFPNMKVEEWARRAGLHDLFVSAYPVLSSAAHPTIFDLASYRAFDAGNPFGIDIRPNDAQTSFIIGSAIQFMFDVACAYSSGMGTDLPEAFSRWRHVADQLADGLG